MASSLKGSVTATLEGVAFSFYTPDEVKRLSVKRLSVTPAFDLQGIPHADGLYDPALGCLNRDDVCGTCALEERFCPGHCGHIELPVPIINPQLFKQCFSLLRRTCLFCHQLKLRGGARMRDLYLKQLALLDEGKVWEALKIKPRAKATGVPAGEDAGIECEADSDEPGNEQAADADADLSINQNLLILTKREQIVTALLEDCLPTPARCPYCNCRSPKLRQYAGHKIVAEPMTSKALAQNHDYGTVLRRNIFDQPEFGAAGNAAAAQATAAAHGKDDSDEDELEIIDDDEADDSSGARARPQGDFDVSRSFMEDESHSNRHWVSPLEVREHLRRLWKNSSEVCGAIWNHIVKKSNHRLQRVATSYEIFFLQYLLVPPTRFRPPSKTTIKERVVFTEHMHNSHLNSILISCDYFRKEVGGPNVALADINGIKARTWSEMQLLVGRYYSNDTGTTMLGIQQVLDKKEGLFRRNMMGKRVNYAARTVISPDPYIETDEIGVPLVFAKKLSVPTPVTWLNYKAMAEAVVNGAEEYPGALMIEKNGFKRRLDLMPRAERLALSKTLMERDPLRPDECAIVHRNMESGDYVLLNRQPSLHKPSMLGQKVKVLGNERVMRMHYANCNTFNADFDGDEMNIHLPQTLDAKADCRFTAMSRDNYLGPKDGNPLRGLIQDHVLSGVLLTMKDTFFSREEYQQLLYGAVFSVRPLYDVVTDPPAIMKPVPLWTGKQVVSAIVKHILYGKPLFNYVGGTRVKGETWGPSGIEEGTVQFRGGDLVTGIIDKAQCGASANGFVHSCYTLYGGDVAERLLSCLGRVFTKYLQQHGFTCGMDDFLLSDDTERKRKDILSEAGAKSSVALSEFLGMQGKDSDPVPSVERLQARLRARLLKDPQDEAALDGAMKKVSHELTSSVVDAAIPRGLMKKWPTNNFLLMVTTGAKGSTVNFSMIACCLGQMELEGKRVARQMSGCTLPSFEPYQTDVGAGGFIAQRFLTGVRPQEFFFHNMAGREGLVDTAVKTARSGYLQRCIIKHLESLKVSYDGTVRDSDGSIVQFAYGDDGLDSVHHNSVYNLKLWKDNAAVAAMRFASSHVPNIQPAVRQYHKAYLEGKVDKLPNGGNKMVPLSDRLVPGPLMESFSPYREGVISDKFLDSLKEAGIDQRSPLFGQMVRNYLRLQVSPGDSVGVVAGQSIGEPSTQMTLNTFHLAGHGDVNVTLGIPRLRELLMSATKPRVPSMSIPVLDAVDDDKLDDFRMHWKNAPLVELVTDVVCSRVLPEDQAAVALNTIYLKFDEDACEEFGLSWDDIMEIIREKVSVRLVIEMERDIRKKALRAMVSASAPAVEEQGDGEAADEEAAAAAAAAAKGSKKNKRAKSSKTKRRRKRGSDEEDEEEQDEFSPEDKGEELVPFADELEEDEEEPEAAEAAIAMDLESSEDEEEMAAVAANGEDEYSTTYEFLGQTDADGFVSEAMPYIILKKSERPSPVRLLGIAGHAKERVARLRIITALNGPQVLVSSMVEAVVKEVRLRFHPSITRTLYVEPKGDKKAHVVTEGCNIPFAALHGDVLDMSALKCNDISHILKYYGVEAARAALAEELAAVFQAYGINVGARHLSLIADYQCFHGGFRGFNRHRMSSHKNSPFLNMSFETSTKVAVDAALRGLYDDCTSSSAQLVLGVVPDVGTGDVELMVPLTME